MAGRGEGRNQKASVCILEAVANGLKMYLMYEIRSKVYFFFKRVAPGTLLTGSLIRADKTKEPRNKLNQAEPEEKKEKKKEKEEGPAHNTKRARVCQRLDG